MEAGDAIWTGSAQTAREEQAGSSWPGKATEGRQRQGQRQTESMGSAEEAGPARVEGTECWWGGVRLGLRLQWGFDWGVRATR